MTPFELKKWREDQNLTRSGLAQILGVDNGTIGRWETGKRRMPALLEWAIEAVEYRPGTIPRDPSTFSQQELESEIATIREILKHRIKLRAKFDRPRFCKYRPCRKLLIGRRNKEYCGGKCRTREYLERQSAKSTLPDAEKAATV